MFGLVVMLFYLGRYEGVGGYWHATLIALQVL